MRLNSIDDLPSGLRFVLAVGMFDGVHRGHRRVLEALTRAALARAAQSVVLTFEPHPSAVLRGSSPPLLCDRAEGLARIEGLGVGIVVVQRFDDEFADQSPEVFLERICIGRRLVGLVMTPETAFGRDRSGSLSHIRRLSGPLGFEVIEIEQVATRGAALSSTRLRDLLQRGRLADVARLLGHPYAVVGEVVPGDRRGRSLGYPTANLAFSVPVALPPDGIYAVRASWGGDNALQPSRTADGVASLGVRPTFGGGARVLEVHLFEVDEDLYGERLRVEFVRRLRGEKLFPSAAALVRQMDRDVQRARQVLAGAAT
jgi:riboflavin kinase/FMN adenylyltransferase